MNHAQALESLPVSDIAVVAALVAVLTWLALDAVHFTARRVAALWRAYRKRQA